MTAPRLKLLSLALVAILGCGLLLAWSQDWFVIEVAGSAHAVGGDVAAGAIAATGLATLALVAALALAGAVIRVVLAVLTILLGATSVVASVFVLREPVVAIAPVVTELTGVAGSASVAALVDGLVATGWPVVAIVAGALVSATGVLIAATSSRWPVAGRRYGRTRLVVADDQDPVGAWDSLSEGEDPTLERG